MKALYAGSFDPVTLGHIDIIKRAAKLCGGLTVAKGARAEDLSINAGTRSLLYSYFQSHPPVSG